MNTFAAIVCHQITIYPLSSLKLGHADSK